MRCARKCIALILMVCSFSADCGFAAAVQGLQVTPVDEDEALVFPLADDVRLTLRTTNPTGRDVGLVASVRPFQGVPLAAGEREKALAQGQTLVAYGVSQYCRIDTLSDQTIKSVEAIAKTGAGEVRVNLGRLPRGLHMLDLDFIQGEATLKNTKYPLFMAEDVEPREYAAPALPVGVYTRQMQYRRTEGPLWWKTYCHAMALDLRRHHVNAVIACGGFSPGEVEIYNRYGLAGISRSGQMLDHPGVMASLIDDEPHPGEELEALKRKYAELRQKTDAIITTCMIGESMGLGTAGDPVNLWKELNPQARLFRWYGVKKHFYDALYPVYYKGALPFTSVLRIVEASSEIPWWVTLPAFGNDAHEAYFQNPAPAQVRCMTHLALAYGADGLIFFQYQEGLVDPVTLRPRDDKLAALGEVLGAIQPHMKLLRSLKHVGLDVRCPSPVVEALPLGVPEGPLHVYAVNKDARHPVSTQLLLWADVWQVSSLRDVYGGQELPLTRDAEGYWSARLTLEPGEGKLLVTDAKLRP
jgi:hypothetical protein